MATAFTYKIKVDEVEQSSVELLSMSWGLTEPRTCTLRESTIRGDSTSTVITPNAKIEISTDDWATKIFTGWVKRRMAKNAVNDGIEWFAVDMKWRLLYEIRAKRNGGYVWAYNRDGRPDGTAPGYHWYGFWTVGEAFIDMLEHALDLPNAGTGPSDIPSHHTDSSDVNNTFLTTSEIAGYTNSDILAMTRELVTGEVSGHFLGEMFNYLCSEQTDYAWYIDPNTSYLVVVDISASSAVNVNAGELGSHVEKSGEGYNLQVLDIQHSLEGVYSKVTFQGMDKHTEVKPSDIYYPSGIDPAGIGDAALEKGWDPDLELGWDLASWENGDYDDDDSYEWVWRRYIVQPEAQWPWVNGYVNTAGANIYSGWPFYDDGVSGKWRSTNGTAGSFLPYPDKGVVLFFDPVPAPYSGYDMYAWYRWREPFVVSVGHSGSAYTNYGHEAELVIVDEQLVHSTSQWPDDDGYNAEEVRDDTTRMTAMANTIHSMVSKETVSAEFQVAPIDLSTYTLNKKINIQNLEQWSSIGLQIINVSIDPVTNQMRLQCANKIEGVTKDGMNWYQGEMKRFKREQIYRRHRRWLNELRDLGYNAAPGS